MLTVGRVRPIATAATQQRHARRVWGLWYAGVLGLTVVVAGIAYVTAPEPFSLAGLILIILALAALARPQWGLCAIAVLAVAGDTITVPWYPFVKNLSSKESILFVGNGLSINPTEAMILATALGWLWSMASTRQWTLRRGTLFRPVMAFTAFVALGLGYGLSRGGNTIIGLSQARPILALALVYILVTNLFDRAEQYRRIWAALLVGVVIDSVFGIGRYFMLPDGDRGSLESLGVHTAALHANAFLVLMLAMIVMSGRAGKRLGPMLVCTPVVVAAYLLSQRRAAFVGLALGAVMLSGMLARRRPKTFRKFMPVAALVFLGYIGVFWNSQASIGFPAQAVKTVVAPGQLTAEDKSSDLYREIETYNVVYTIKSDPLTGLGFGHKYLQPRPNADISFFRDWEYFPHNAIMGMWIWTGVGGFIAMLYLLVSAVRQGTLRLLRVPTGYDSALLLTSVVYVVMFAAFAYVDQAWDYESMLFLGVSFAYIANATSSPTAEPATGRRTRTSSDIPSDAPAIATTPDLPPVQALR